MNPRNSDRAFDWMVRNSPGAPQAYKAIWTAIVADHPAEFTSRGARKKLWNTLRLELETDSRFAQSTSGIFTLAPDMAAIDPPPPQTLQPLQPSDAQLQATNAAESRSSPGYGTSTQEQHEAEWKDDRDFDDHRPIVLPVSDANDLGGQTGISRRTPMKQIEAWTIEVLQDLGGAAHFREIAAAIETTRALTDADMQPQEGHEDESALAYRCRWAITRLRKRGVLKPRGGRGMIELSVGTPPFVTELASVKNDQSHPDESTHHKKHRAGKIYTETGGQLLEHFVREHFADGGEHARDEILKWFTEHYPRFKRVTVQCNIDQHTTNYPSRAHFGAGPKHDLLFRINGDPNRLRLYRPGEDPPPIYHVDKQAKGESGERKTKSPKHTVASVPPREQHRRLLKQLSTYGELATGEAERLGVSQSNLQAWLDALLVERPRTRVVSPLFLNLIEADASPPTFVTALAVQLMGEHLHRVVKSPLTDLEDYVWQRFGSWHLPQPHVGDAKWHGYLQVPVGESRDLAASERLDMFSRLTPSVIGELIRDCGFLAEQQGWSAEAANKGALGPLSRQVKQGIRRPLFLSTTRLLSLDEGPFDVRTLPREEVLRREHVVAGLPICTAEEWDSKTQFHRETLSERLLEHPVHAVIVQLEIHRLFSGISGDKSPSLRLAGQDQVCLELDGADQGPLWAICRQLLTNVGYWPIGTTSDEANWPAAIRAAIDNLETVGVLERAGEIVRLTEQFASATKAHPGLSQNRGEKPFRIQLAKFLEGTQGDSA